MTQPNATVYNHSYNYFPQPCTHKLHLQCLKEYYQLLIESQAAYKIRCPHCHPTSTFYPFTPEQKQVVLDLFPIETDPTSRRFMQQFNTDKVLKHKHISHCPVADCFGVVEPKEQDWLSKQVRCDHCGAEVCASCRLVWHQGTECTQERRDRLVWRAVGDMGTQLVNRCPRCLVIFEKDGGCRDMSCNACGYQWCWICGMSLESDWHREYLVHACRESENVAELWREKKWPSFRLYLLVFVCVILFPAFLLIGAVFAVGGITYDKYIKKGCF